MEHEAKQQLIARLDECLLQHAAALNEKDEGPTIYDVYNLQDLAELHYYLKVRHVFTPAEVEELLKFADPLDVARWCREDNSHEHSFPICELLKEINAYERFALVEKQPSPLHQKYTELMKLLGRNWYDYQESLLSYDKPALIGKAEEIAAAAAAYRYMAEQYEPQMEEVDYLLRYDNPLQVLQGYWPSRDMILGPSVIEIMMDDIESPPEERAEQPKSLRERLQNAAREAGKRLSPGTPAHDNRGL